MIVYVCMCVLIYNEKRMKSCLVGFCINHIGFEIENVYVISDSLSIWCSFKLYNVAEGQTYSLSCCFEVNCFMYDWHMLQDSACPIGLWLWNICKEWNQRTFHDRSCNYGLTLSWSESSKLSSMADCKLLALNNTDSTVALLTYWDGTLRLT